MALVESRDRIHERLSHGGSLAEVTAEIIDPAPYSEEQKAALWLYAAATIPRDFAGALAEGARRRRSPLSGVSAALRRALSQTPRLLELALAPPKRRRHELGR